MKGTTKPHERLQLLLVQEGAVCAAEIHHLHTTILAHLDHCVDSGNGRVLRNDIRDVRVPTYAHSKRKASPTDQEKGLLRQVLLPHHNSVLHDFKPVGTSRQIGPVGDGVASVRRSFVERQTLLLRIKRHLSQCSWKEWAQQPCLLAGWTKKSPPFSLGRK